MSDLAEFVLRPVACALWPKPAMSALTTADLPEPARGAEGDGGARRAHESEGHQRERCAVARAGARALAPRPLARGLGRAAPLPRRGPRAARAARAPLPPPPLLPSPFRAPPARALPRTVLADDEIDVRIEVDAKVLVVHKVLEDDGAQHAVLVRLHLRRALRPPRLLPALRRRRRRGRVRLTLDSRGGRAVVLVDRDGLGVGRGDALLALAVHHPAWRRARAA